MPDLRVLIVAGDALARAGLAAQLSQQPGVIIVGQIGLSPDLVPEIEQMVADGEVDLFMPNGHYSPRLNGWVARTVAEHMGAS